MNLRSLSLLAAVLLLAAGCKQDVGTSTSTGGGSSGAAPAASTQQQGVVPGSKEDFEATAGDRVFFDFDKSNIKPEGQQTLEKQAAWLKKYPDVPLRIEGNCDDRGTREYNLALGNRRAVAVKNALVALGIPAARIKTISYGKEKPAVVGDNEAAWAQNRNGITDLNPPAE